MAYYSFDIGGTSIKHAIVSKEGKIIKRFNNIMTGLDITNDEIKDSLYKNILSAQKKHNVKGVAVSSTGVVDSHQKRVIFSGPTFPNYGKSDLFLELEEVLAIPLTIENDVNCAALGELWKGNLSGSKNSLLLTIGTGIGGAIVIDGKIYRGSQHAAGEIGYMSLKKGLFQDIASTSQLVEKVSMLKGRELDGYDVIKLAKKEDKETMLLLEEFVFNLAEGIVNLSYILNPEKIILGGGIMAEFDYLYPLIRDSVDEQLLNPYFNSFKIEKAKLGNDAGLIGAVKHHLDS